ncbi:MAG: DUF4330 domain-containing protein [Clostridia bacterium]|nr:DUF4330 domain-containing protein [Clostridia bacterium]
MKDNNVKIKSDTRLNAIDILIIVLVVACIAAICVRFYFTNNVDPRSESVTIQFSVDGISDVNAAEYKNGQKVYLSSNDVEIGYFDTVKSEYMMIDAIDDDGHTVRVTHPDKMTVTGSIVLMGKWTDNGFAVNGNEIIRLGSKLNLYTSRNTFTLTVDGIPQNPTAKPSENDQ